MKFLPVAILTFADMVSEPAKDEVLTQIVAFLDEIVDKQ